jgi:release factor glutamine methyltransferase
MNEGVIKNQHKKILQTILKQGVFEDIEKELSLATYHLKKSKFFEEEFGKLVNGLEQNKPVSHIIGYTFVCSVPIIINQNVMHPGPETITLIEKVVQYIKTTDTTDVLDLCAGSGAIAIVIAKSCGAMVTAVDISEFALKVAEINMVANKVQVEFLQGDLFQPVKNRLFDVIVSNPPYTKTDEISRLPSFIRDFNPQIAIDGGVDGLFFHKEILQESRVFLRPKGVLFLECKDDQDKEIIDLCEEYHWRVKDKHPNRHNKIRSFELSPY